MPIAGVEPCEVRLAIRPPSLEIAGPVPMMHRRVETTRSTRMAEERDQEQSDRPPSDAVKGKKADEPLRPPSTDKDEAAPETIETDLLNEDRFEATDN
jgi:hypothetical protein